MIDFVLIAAETSASFSEVWPYIAATATGIAVPLMAVIRWQHTEKLDLIKRLDDNKADHKTEMKDVLLPAVKEMTTAITADAKSQSTLGSDVRDLKTTIDIRFAPKQGGQ